MMTIYRGKVVYHKIFGKGEVDTPRLDDVVVIFEKFGKRAVTRDSLFENPVQQAGPIKTLHFSVGSIVYHKNYGKGVITECKNLYANVDFDDCGLKSVAYELLNLIPNEGHQISNKVEEKYSPLTNIHKSKNKEVKVSDLDVVKTVISYLNGQKKTNLLFDECVNVVKDELYREIPRSFIKTALEPTNNIVYLKHIEKILNRLKKDQYSKKKITFETTKTQKNELPSVTKTHDLHDFIIVCTKDPFHSTFKMYFARAIIDLCKDIKIVKKDALFTYEEISKKIMNSYLYQISVGKFINEGTNKQPSFYKIIEESVDDNFLTTEEFKNIVCAIKKELTEKYVYFFLRLSNAQIASFYKIDTKGLLLSKTFIESVKKEADVLDNKIILRLSYYLGTINKNTSLVKTYEMNLKHGLDKTKFVLKFEYERSLELLKKTLTKDFYLKTKFKELMKRFEIPATEVYLRMCLDRLDYSLKGKRIILSSKYSTFKSYVKELVLKDEIYRYSNPDNLDEYDSALKGLQYDLIIIEVGNGVYITQKNLEKNGITTGVIEHFQSEVIKIGHDLKFFSVKQLAEILENNPVVEYCGGDERQLLQFIKPIQNIKIIDAVRKGAILSFSNSNNYRGELIEFIMDKKDAMDIYDIKDFIEDVFDVEYSIEDIEKDIKKTDFYFSEEMEKVYKTKEIFIKEVYYDGN